MGLQRVRHDWANEQQQRELLPKAALSFSPLNLKEILEIFEVNNIWSKIILSIPFNLNIQDLNIYKSTKWHHYWFFSILLLSLIVQNNMFFLFSCCHVWLFWHPMDCEARQTPLSMGYPRQEHWSRLPFPSPGHLPDSGIKPKSPVLTGEFFTTEPTRRPQRITWGWCFTLVLNYIYLVLKMIKNQTIIQIDLWSSWSKKSKFWIYVNKWILISLKLI